MLHQIRKMIGMAIAVVRGDADESVITDSWNTDRIDIPRAPGLGLMLEEVRKKSLLHIFVASACPNNSSQTISRRLAWCDFFVS